MGRSIPVNPNKLSRAAAAAQVGDLFHQINHRIRRAAAAEFEPLGLTGSQMRALRTIHVHSGQDDGPIRMSALADALGIVRRSATSVVDDLEQRGFVERVHDSDDRRAVGVRITDEGRATIAEVRGRRLSAAGQVLQPLSTDELLTLRTLLQRLCC